MNRRSQQLAQITEWLRPQIEAYRNAHHIVELLLGDICSAPAGPLKEIFARYGVSPEAFDRMTEDEKWECAKAIIEKQPTRTENLMAALDIIFEARYGWPEGTVRNLSMQDVVMALEHATEYDSPDRPSIWKITT